MKHSSFNNGYSALLPETSDKQIAANALYRNYGFVEIRKEFIDGYIAHGLQKKINLSGHQKLYLF
jgi:predicted GNAT family N-acyltransferase